MTTARDALLDHLGHGVTTVCRAWLVRRKDGATFGFTDHDTDLGFDGYIFKASSGLTARALQQSSGLAVDNSETLGALSDAAIEEADIVAGRFDGAEVRTWLVNWADVSQRMEQFRGSFGEITRSGGAFKAELRGLTDQLNQPRGRIYQRSCSAMLGDRRCGVDVTVPGFSADVAIGDFDATGRMMFSGLAAFANGWFERGRLTVLTGAAAGLVGIVKSDQLVGSTRSVDLWQAFAVQIAVGDHVRLQAGCDRTSATCKTKFANFVNFRGFPHLPGEDWLASYPVASRPNDGGSMGR